jgi:hypothetical protein
LGHHCKWYRFMYFRDFRLPLARSWISKFIDQTDKPPSCKYKLTPSHPPIWIKMATKVLRQQLEALQVETATLRTQVWNQAVWP